MPRSGITCLKNTAARRRMTYFPLLAAIALMCVMSRPAPGLAERLSLATERIQTDPMTGFALAGYDPVAYFVEGEPVAGNGDHELAWKGVVWRFANIGNLEAFRDAPDIYAPQFGGYGALAVARGYAAQASPRIWVIHDQKLYFFATPVSRAAWLKLPDQLADEGQRRWPEIERTLVR